MGLALSLAGLNTAAKGGEGFRTAMTLTIATLVIGVITIILGSGELHAIFSMVGSILNLAVIYHVCNTTVNMLEERGNHELSRRGVLVWKLNLICAVVLVICSLIFSIPRLNLLAALAALVAALIAGIFYLMFLYSASKSLTD